MPEQSHLSETCCFCLQARCRRCAQQLPVLLSLNAGHSVLSIKTATVQASCRPEAFRAAQQTPVLLSLDAGHSVLSMEPATVQASCRPRAFWGSPADASPAERQCWALSAEHVACNCAGQLPAKSFSGQPSENAQPSTLPQSLQQRASEELHQAAPAGGGGHPANDATGMPQNTGLGQRSSSDAAGGRKSHSGERRQPSLQGGSCTVRKAACLAFRVHPLIRQQGYA